MGSLYRSEEMRFCQMIVEKDAAFNCVAEIGKRPCVQFKDVSLMKRKKHVLLWKVKFF